jgi:hypothetical protein
VDDPLVGTIGALCVASAALVAIIAVGTRSGS